MNRISWLASSLFLSLLCAFVGYRTGRALSPDQETPPLLDGAHLPRFSMNTGHAASRPKEKNVDLADGHSLDVLLVRYSRMTPEQMEKEITRIYTLSQTTGDTQRSELLLTYLSYKWGQLTPRQALGKLSSMNYPRPSCMFPMIIQGWAEVAPESAASHLLEHRDSLPLTKYALRVIADEMGQANPAGAMKWQAGIITEINEEERNQALFSVLSGIAKAHPEQIEKYAAQLAPKDFETMYGAVDLAAQWATSDWKGASRWINSMPSEVTQRMALNAALKNLSVMNPEKNEAGISAFLHQWATISPEETADWLKNSPLPDYMKKKLPGSGEKTSREE